MIPGLDTVTPKIGAAAGAGAGGGGLGAALGALGGGVFGSGAPSLDSRSGSDQSTASTSSARGNTINFGGFDSGVNFAPKPASTVKWVAVAVIASVAGLVALKMFRGKK